MPAEFAPRDLLERALRQWWLLAVMIVVGGIAGWIVFLFRLPVYEANASITATVDLTRTGPLTENEEDMAVNMIDEIMATPQVYEPVIARALDQNIPLDVPSLLRISRVERYGENFTLRIRHSDPETASILANLWIEEAHSILTQASRHAQQADQIRRYLTSLENCMQDSSVQTDLAFPCSLQSANSIQAEIFALTPQLASEINASLGLWPAVTIGPGEIAQIPNKPTLRGLNTLILAGGLIGFVLGIWAIGIDLPGQIRLRRQYA
jgi:uncharacterized protein involved in exopolysaccharide biosynthesis